MGDFIFKLLLLLLLLLNIMVNAFESLGTKIEKCGKVREGEENTLSIDYVFFFKEENKRMDSLER